MDTKKIIKIILQEARKEPHQFFAVVRIIIVCGIICIFSLGLPVLWECIKVKRRNIKNKRAWKKENLPWKPY